MEVNNLKVNKSQIARELGVDAFYYKRVLWQYLKDNHSLDCAQPSFRRYISNNVEFNDYFKRRKKGYISNKSNMRFETDKGQTSAIRLER